MAKRSDFQRRPMDDYSTPYPAVPPLLPHLRGIKSFAEPCCGARALVMHMERHGYACAYSSDIRFGDDALAMTYTKYDAIITNPPWTRELLHPMILHFQSLAPTWLLFDAGWAFTRQAAPYLPQCSHIVAVGRLKWIEGSPYTGKDDCAWYRFHGQHSDGPKFYGRQA